MKVGDRVIVNDNGGVFRGVILSIQYSSYDSKKIFKIDIYSKVIDNGYTPHIIWCYSYNTELDIQWYREQKLNILLDEI